MRHPVRSLLLAGCCAALFAATAGATEKTGASTDAPNPCDVYGPGHKPVGTTGTCIKIGGSVEVEIGTSSSGGPPSAATSTDWIRTKPAKGGN